MRTWNTINAQPRGKVLCTINILLTTSESNAWEQARGGWTHIITRENFSKNYTHERAKESNSFPERSRKSMVSDFKQALLRFAKVSSVF